MDRQPAVVLDKAKLPELVHEVTDPRPRGADHLRQVFLIDSGKHRFSFSFLADHDIPHRLAGRKMVLNMWCCSFGSRCVKLPRLTPSS